ncbi:serine peptidase, family S28 [Geopyxis carbonaria]|nr:serine peptidase, family S28 [Geopyxis carbonaria]
MVKLNLGIFLSVAALWSSTVFAGRGMREVQIEKELEKLEEDTAGFRAAAVPTVSWENVSLPIDYSGNYYGNFTNRYWVVDEYYEPGGPIFVFDTGESNGGQGYLGYLTRNTTFFNRYLREFKGLGIVWEHRYYGESLPFPISLNTTSEEMQYLTTENALKDFDVFANQFSWKNSTVSPKLAPWVVVGGSYPGMRAAFLRHLYPDTVYAAYAASPPVQAQVDMSAYYEQVYRGLVNYGLSNCTSRIKLAVDYIDSQLAYPAASAKIKQKFLGRTAEANSNAGFADALSMVLWGWQSGGVDATIRSFCDHLDASAPGSETLATREKGKHFSNAWAAWPPFSAIVSSYTGSTCEGATPLPDGAPLPDCRLDDRFTGTLSISWTWQYCTEWGFFQSTNAGPHAVGSKYNSQSHQQELCYRQFPDGLSSGLLPRRPRTAAINAVTGGWHMRPSNTFFTEGEFDPWRTLSPLSDERFSPRFEVSAEVPICGVPTGEREVFGKLLKEAEHCYDFRASPQGDETTAMFATALRGWLKCFGRGYRRESVVV